MVSNSKQFHLWRPWVLIVLLSVAACQPKKVKMEARQASKQQQWEQAYKLWDKVLDNKPDNTEAKMQREHARIQAVVLYLNRANDYFANQQYKEADAAAQLVLAYDPHNQAARDLRNRVREAMQAIAAEAAMPAEEDPQSELPLLNPNTWEPQNLYFPKQQDVREVYQALGKAYGINILVDPGIRAKKIQVDLRELDFLKALEALMILNKHFFKVVADNTLIILDDNKTNRENYENQIVKTFYLSNITPQDLKNHLRTLGNFKEFGENEELNAITIKGTPEQIALAEKIISANDKSQAEVLIEIELLEVNKSTMRNVGLLPVNSETGQPTYRAGIIASPRAQDDNAEDSGALRGFFPDLSSEDFLTIIPAVVINFLKETGDTKQVANPKLRVTGGEEAEISIGQRIPIASTSFTTPNLSGSAGGASNFGEQALTTFQYNDVGIGIKVKPRVHHNGEITLNLNLEVSSVVSAGLQPTLSQRKVSTTIRLKNGETNVLAGLLTNEERRSLSGIIGLADIPILGRLFSNTDKVINQTDIILTMRPVIVRGPNITNSDRAAHEVSNLRLLSIYRKRADEAKQKDQAEQASQERETPGAVTRPNENEAPQPVSRGQQPDPVQNEDDYDLPAPPTAQKNDSDPVADQVAPGTTEMGTPTVDDQEAEAGEDSALMSTAMIAFTPASSQLNRDESVEVNLFLANVQDMARGQILVEFDPELVQVLDIGGASFFGERNQRPFVTPVWDNANGRASIVIGKRAQAEPLTGTGIMATLRLRAINPGETLLRVTQVKMERGDGTMLSTRSIDARIEVLP